MPRHSKDYSKSVIYKIQCKDKNIENIYVGQTTNLQNRMHVHKNHYNNKVNNKLYENMFLNGGFENWEVVILENCENILNSKELNMREQYWIDLLKPTLNNNLSIYISYDGKICDGTNKERTNFRQKKCMEELFILRNKITGLEEALNKSLQINKTLISLNIELLNKS